MLTVVRDLPKEMASSGIFVDPKLFLLFVSFLCSDIMSFSQVKMNLLLFHFRKMSSAFNAVGVELAPTPSTLTTLWDAPHASVLGCHTSAQRWRVMSESQ